MLPDIKELTKDQLILWLEDRSIKSYRAKQILMWIYMRQADTFEVMTDVGKDIRKCLTRHFSIKRLKKERTETSQDGSKKFLFKLIDGKYVERLGWYNPHLEGKEDASVNEDRINYWIERGAQLSENAQALVARKAPAVIKASSCDDIIE